MWKTGYRVRKELNTLSMWFLPILFAPTPATVVAAPDAFPVYWNIQTAVCNRDNASVPLEDFQIIHNTGEGFMGDKIVVFYERKFGLCPYYNNSDPNQPINGGLPQNQTLEDHLDAIKKQIQTEIPDQNFSGLAVIDVEEFRPLYSMNWGQKTVYKKQSMELIKAKNPNIDQEQVEKEAEKAYNEAAKKFFVATITTARKLRPNAKWGYYDYPFCNTNSANAEGDYECSTQAKAFNDE
ncbi:hypothetical protein Y032_0487g2338 [Ancylostoma ceylanicum]|uniref:Hyaluronidase n=2 Tax=Ancylostoma ceylanicum TaxID=53326 RepID=A0A016WUZ3_9BILA|nr:hypothetical protein Y032_0487g2338 [Ancylostoma ceylanicum]